MSAFVLNVSDLLGHPGGRRGVVVDGPLRIHLDLASVEGPVHAELRLESTVNEIIAKGTVDFTAQLRCNRCLTEWSEPMQGAVMEVFGQEDGPGIGRDGSIDVEQTLRDETVLAIPLVPLCKPDCRGLCPTCGTDLNTDPCSGHSDESESPFGALRHLLEP
jgi:uncharacterized protein